MAYWILKSDPESYSWIHLEKDKSTVWDGVRNYQARNNLKLMKKGDIAFIYHSNDDKALVGLVSITKEFFQDPTTDDKNWVSVEIKVKGKLKKPVFLADMKKHDLLMNIGLVKQSRLSVIPINEAEYNEIIRLSK